MLFRQIHDPRLAQYAYLIGCQKTGEALLIDPERDIDRYLALAEEEQLRIVAVAETHIHADFLSGAREFALRHGVRVYLSDEGGEGWDSAWARTGEVAVHFLRDGDSFHIGGIEIVALHTPGHTPEHLSYLVIDRGGGASDPMGIVTGDFVFVGDLGRPDLLEEAAGIEGAGDPAARQLFHSLPRFLELPDHLQIWPGHGAGSACGKALGAIPQSTVGYERRHNASIDAHARGEEGFVAAILSGQPEPQSYFARMKRDNQRGVPILGDLPQPRLLGSEEVRTLVEAGEHWILDTRSSVEDFQEAHLPGSLYAPLDRTFSTTVGSLLLDETAPLLLVIDEAQVEEAVRDLVRIGYDRVEGYLTPEVLNSTLASGVTPGRVETITFDELESRRQAPEVAVVDVRFADEFAAGHVPGAIHIPYTRLPLLAEARLPRDRELLVHCGVGARSAVAVPYLLRAGYLARQVSGAIRTYREQFPMETGPWSAPASTPIGLGTAS